MKCAIYARVSTEDQDCQFQLDNLRAFVRRSEWPAAVEYVEKLSGMEGGKRPEMERLMEDVRMKRVDLVLVWRMDRFGRSTLDTLQNVKTLDYHKVRFLCPTMNIDTDDKSPVGKFTLHLFAAIVELERGFILERTAVGYKAYRKAHTAGLIGKGSRHSKSKKDLLVGRPKKIFGRDSVAALLKSGLSVRAITRKLKIRIPADYTSESESPQL